MFIFNNEKIPQLSLSVDTVHHEIPQLTPQRVRLTVGSFFYRQFQGILGLQKPPIHPLQINISSIKIAPQITLIMCD